MRLYEIADEIERILAQEVDHATGEITDETLAALDALEMELEAKVLAIAAYMKGERAEAKAVAIEIGRLQDRKKRHENRADRLLEKIAEYTPKDATFSDGRSLVQWYKKAPACEITGVVPKEYRRIPAPAPWAPDKAAILRDLKAGKEIEGAQLLSNLKRLSVK